MMLDKTSKSTFSNLTSMSWCLMCVSSVIRNPGGRTGIRGRGALSRLGPNLNVDLVLTRWVVLIRTFKNRHWITWRDVRLWKWIFRWRDNERSVLEYLAVWGESRGTLALPSVSPAVCSLQVLLFFWTLWRVQINLRLCCASETFRDPSNLPTTCQWLWREPWERSCMKN